MPHPSLKDTSSEPRPARSSAAPGYPHGTGLPAFRFERDTFTFANELIWRYEFDRQTGAMKVCRSDPPPTYSHRCFVVVRSARQFAYHARFDPDLPRLKASDYVPLIRQTVSRNPRRPSRAVDRLVFPGYHGLREFSSDHESELKANCGGPLQSYFLRSHWRMVFPVPAWHQERIARQLTQRVREGMMPLVHLFQFPRVTINHGILLYETREDEGRIEFRGYDPNITAEPVRLFYHAQRRAFDFPPAIYWSGGRVKVIEIFRGGLY